VHPSALSDSALNSLPDRPGARSLPLSITPAGDGLIWIEQTPGGRVLSVAAPSASPLLADFQGDPQPAPEGLGLLHCPLTAPNAQALRGALSGLQPRPLGLATSAGFGDRLGLATPGHVRALRETLARRPGRAIAPLFAQQSIREMTRTRRTPHAVLTDATFGALAAGWTGPVGADADHLKSPEDIDACLAAGFSMFTFDPGAHVDPAADTDSPAALEQKLAALPWAELESSPDDLRRRFADRLFDLGDRALRIDPLELARAAAKYGRAVAHVARLARHLDSRRPDYDLEISVDETETPTSPAEHLYLAVELARLGVRWVSLAPRFVGRFEKGVDYLGDTRELAAQLSLHAAIARAVGAGPDRPYKLSLHSGSDKFSVYPLICAATGGLVHLKTAGTSYLEALRVFTTAEPDLFRQILDLGRACYDDDRRTYHVSARLDRVTAAADLNDADLPALLDDFDARQVLHVTYGSALDRFGAEIHQALRRHETAYEQTLARHFGRHLEPFAAHAES